MWLLESHHGVCTEMACGASVLATPDPHTRVTKKRRTNEGDAVVAATDTEQYAGKPSPTQSWFTL